MAQDRGKGVGIVKYKNALVPEKKQREPTYNLTARQIEDIREAARREGLKAGMYACNAMFSVSMLQAMRDGLGFGQRRLKVIFERVQMLFNQIVAGELAYTDMAQVLREECNINLIIEKPDGTPADAMELFAKMRPKGFAVKIRGAR